MTEGQRESLFMVYVSACNGLMYADDLYKDKTMLPHSRQNIGVLVNKFKWIKQAMELKVTSGVLREVDTLRFDEVQRLMMNLPPDKQDELESLVKKFVSENQKNDNL